MGNSRVVAKIQCCIDSLLQDINSTAVSATWSIKYEDQPLSSCLVNTGN